VNNHFFFFPVARTTLGNMDEQRFQSIFRSNQQRLIIILSLVDISQMSSFIEPLGDAEYKSQNPPTF